MTGAELKRQVMQKHRGKSPADAFAAEWQDAAGSDERAQLAKAAPNGSVEAVEFEATAEGSVGALYKNDESGDFAIWGPASVEVVDKENDRIQASALENALPQLLKRSALSFEHQDQIVGEILEKFETEEPVTIDIGDNTFKREEFPTDVLDLDGIPPALYVAGNVYGDTQKSQNVREAIEKGDIRSYSISGEAVVSSLSVENGDPVTDISKLDLSAITLCRKGMNQRAKFGVVQKRGDIAADPSDNGALTRERAAHVLKSKTMSGDTSGSDEDPLTKSGMNDILDKHLPDGDIPTVEQVEGIVDDRVEKEVEELREEEPDPEPDPEPEPEPEPDPEPEAEPEPDPEPDPEPEPSPEETAKQYSRDQLKSVLTDDQWKVVSKQLDEAEGDAPEDGMEVVEGEEVEDADPADDEMLAAKAQSLGLDPQTLTDDQKTAISKAVDGDGLEKASGPGAVGGGSGTPAHAGEGDLNTDDDDELAKSDTVTQAGSNFFDSDGGVKL